MNDKDFSEIVACFKEASQSGSDTKKPAGTSELDPTSVKAIRTGLGLTQKKFAAMIGISVAMLQGWEKGNARPDGPAQALLQVAAKHPKAVLDALQS